MMAQQREEAVAARTGFILAGHSSVVKLRIAMWSAMALLGAAGTLAGMYLPDLSRHVGIPPETAGVIFTVQLLGGLILTPAAGRLVDAAGQRTVLLGSIVLTTLGLAAIPLCGSMAAAMAAIFVFGTGFDTTIVATNVITASREEQSAPALNWLNMFYGLGAVAAPIVLGFSGVDFRRAYWGMAALMAALLLSILAALPAPAPRQFSNPGAPPPLDGWRQAVSRRGIPLFFLLAAFFYLAVGFELAFSGWITTYLRQDARVSGSASGLGLSTFWLAMVAGRILGAELSRRWSKGRLVSACAVTASAGVLILLLVGGAHASLAAIAVVGLGVAPLFPTGLAIAGEHYPAAVGTVAGIYFAVGSLGGMTIPWLLGEVAGAAGSLAWGMSIHLLLGLLILATMAAVGCYRPGE